MFLFQNLWKMMRMKFIEVCYNTDSIRLKFSNTFIFVENELQFHKFKSKNNLHLMELLDNQLIIQKSDFVLQHTV